MKYVILDNVRSAHNVGSIFRTADGAGVSKVFLTGYTPAPTDRFGRKVAEIKKTSLGASETMLWERTEDVRDVLRVLKEKGFQIVAVEQHARAIPFTQFVSEKDVAYIFGNEVEGISIELCEDADAVVEIPMYGMKESLNVSVAAGIILFH